jgi:DNA-binding response OmpR family regulator
MALLVVEDNPQLAGSLSRGLTEDGFQVFAVSTGGEALARLRQRDIDAMVLDLGLPDMDGMQVLTQARGDGILAPILVLTANDRLEDRVRALELGADDYQVKPFAYAELLARVKALIRRATQPRWAPLGFAGVGLEPGKPEVNLGSRTVQLSPREHMLLELLLRRRGDILSRTDILREAFGYGFDPGTNLVDVHIANLRRKLKDGPIEIETIRGVGFRLRAIAEEK